MPNLNAVTNPAPARLTAAAAARARALPEFFGHSVDSSSNSSVFDTPLSPPVQPGVILHLDLERLILKASCGCLLDGVDSFTCGPLGKWGSPS